MNNLKDLLKNASLEDLQSLVQQKKVELKKEAEKNDFFKKVFEIRNFFRDRNLSLNDFRKMESFFKKSKKTSNIKFNSLEISEIQESEKRGTFNAKITNIDSNLSDLIGKKVRFYGKKMNYKGEVKFNFYSKEIDCYNFIR
jgi:hypothetical protein